MVYRGRILNGEIILDQPIRLPEGAEVRVDVIDQRAAPPTGGDPSLYDEMRGAIGTARGPPDDAARNVDHYLYGHPRK